MSANYVYNITRGGKGLRRSQRSSTITLRCGLKAVPAAPRTFGEGYDGTKKVASRESPPSVKILVPSPPSATTIVHLFGGSSDALHTKLPASMPEISLLYCPKASDFSLDFSAMQASASQESILKYITSLKGVHTTFWCLHPPATPYSRSGRTPDVWHAERVVHPCSGFVGPLFAWHPVSPRTGKGTLRSAEAAEDVEAEVEAETEAEVEVEAGKEVDAQCTSGMVSDSDSDSGHRVEGDREKKEHTSSPWSGVGKCTALGVPASLPASASPSSLHAVLGPAPMQGVDSAECMWGTLLDEFSSVPFERRMSTVLTVHAVPGGRTGRPVVVVDGGGGALRRQRWGDVQGGRAPKGVGRVRRSMGTARAGRGRSEGVAGSVAIMHSALDGVVAAAQATVKCNTSRMAMQWILDEHDNFWEISISNNKVVKADKWHGPHLCAHFWGSPKLTQSTLVHISS
ncbi:hypothetical protein DFH07DRAFT_767540 [Mycena maculata]|uniref:Uncharacterized protein n=1 Tax=Mycena maculata TaxID=230809 RepID=A0AAD7NSD0_9AGAR|nr:hypothetical protein DFH07DRAFT_767540 [Mycena maculata]